MRPRKPVLTLQTLRKLRRLVRGVVRKQGRVVPVKELVDLAAADLPGTVTIDVQATEELGMPLLVLSPRGVGRLTVLTPREIEIAALIADGLLNKQIADRLRLTLGTVKDYVHRIIKKTELPNRAAIAAAFTGSERWRAPPARNSRGR
jgi:DNA-binding NarL/FixJ family response regulator